MRSAAPGASRNVLNSSAERAGALGQAPELEQPEIGVGGLGEPLEDHGQELLHEP